MFYSAVKKVQKSRSKRTKNLELPAMKASKLNGIPQGSVHGYSSTSGTISPSLIEDIDKALEELSMFGDNFEEEIAIEKHECLKTEEEQELERRIKEKLTKVDEHEIHKILQEKLAADIRKIYEEATQKQRDIKKRFREQIKSTRTILLDARVSAERESINRLQKRATEEQSRILHRRKQRNKADAFSVTSIEPNLKDDTEKMPIEQAEMLATLRKIQSNLDRVLARRKRNIAAAKGDIGAKAVNHEVKKLEQAQEIHNIIVELHQLGLESHAKALMRSLASKEEAENALRENLRKEEELAKDIAREKWESEKRKLRIERLEEKEREEEMRLKEEKLEKERLEREKHARLIRDLHKKAYNHRMQTEFAASLLASQISPSWKFSYFPPIVQNETEKEKKEESRHDHGEGRKCLTRPAKTR
ncbi:predicted protein [Nematostella vectensis]|uniref:Uncharacterized protein n=1 Tax=Nematostella vectensis TaxID=45351 RepID=A7SHL5_NEMVE|nr:calponin homology domain-containing protein DDB_G0272472 [Nematostella vectensis]EDO36820.1 predicted protein [Nematostella vectensis]|eukprot:XP_001628883.1 predicted protein [Nematostella vectensis]